MLVWMWFITTILLALWVVKARSPAPNDLQSWIGDKITSAKWNQLIWNVIKTNWGKSMTSNGLYCGSTASSYDGAWVWGYDWAKNKCENTCWNALAHMCNSNELFMTKSLWMAIPDNNWYSSFVRVYTTVGNENECSWWTTNSHTRLWPIMHPTNGSNDYCDISHPIACCK